MCLDPYVRTPSLEEVARLPLLDFQVSLPPSDITAFEVVAELRALYGPDEVFVVEKA